MDEQKMKRAREWLDSAIQKLVPDSTDFRLIPPSVGTLHQLIINRFGKQFNFRRLTSQELEAIADNDETVRTNVYNRLSSQLKGKG